MHCHLASYTFPTLVSAWFLVAFLAVSTLGQLVVVALSVPDSLVQAFFAVAFLSQLV